MNGWRSLFPNALLIAAREYRAYLQRRTFLLGTILLACLALLGTLSPILIDKVVGNIEMKVAVVLAASDLPPDALTTLESNMNAPMGIESKGSRFVLTRLEDAGAADRAAKDGKFDGVLIVSRDPSTKGLTFVLRADIPADSRDAFYVASGANALVQEDQLSRAGIAHLGLVPGQFKVETASPSAGSGGSEGISSMDDASRYIAASGLIILIFMAIVTYGTWVATSVAEEKGSRVMELMLNAVTPLQMLAGKVLGSGAAGLTQYGLVMVAILVGLLARGPVSEAALGTGGSGDATAGLTPGLLVGFLVLFVLGFTLYALLYAAFGSLVSRQEDIQSAITPLTMLVMIGYFGALFASSSPDSTLVRVASFIPFFTPYTMLLRLAVGHVEAWEFALAVALTLASIAVALFVAARIYSAGVLLYGQKVSLRQVLKAARVAR